MPTKAVTICSYPGCTTLVKGGRCERHPYPRRPDLRPSASARGYDSKWHLIRGAYLKAHPYCSYNRKCRPGTLATEVDHEVPLDEGGTSHWDNLRSACKPCHSSKTARLDTPRQGGRFHAKSTV
jgi:5-methylcytosine-specific restriction protein A